MTKKQICKVAGFLLILAVCVTCLSYIFINKWTTVCYESSVPTEFYKLDENSIEVAFFGSSQVAQGISGMKLYEDYGISAYTLGTARQPMLAVYTWLKECYKTQKIKLAVLDVAELYYKSIPESRYRQAFDNMKLSWNKIQALYQHCKVLNPGSADPFFSYIFKVGKYHSRWKDLTEEDYTFYLEEQPVFRGNALYCDKVTLDINRLAYESDEPQDGVEMNSQELFYTEKFLSFCESNGIQVLLIKTPRTDWSITQHQQVEEYAQEKGVPFLDFSSMEVLNAMGIDASNDFMDTKHLNFSGAEKLSGYLGAYLKAQYELTDFRQAEDFDELNYDRYLERKEDSVLQFATDPVEYLAALKNERYEVLIQATADTAGTTPQLQEALADLQLQAKLNELNGGTYVAQIRGGVCVYEEVSGKKLTYSGWLSDGKKFTLTSSYSSEYSPSISVDFENVNYANKGINILVYDHQNNKIIDKSTIAVNAESGEVVLQKENPRRKQFF
ncbi:MAG: hypothetical protein Q4C61_13660 [Lachnospiraceae bacterium]|nr:hypothetical protein [Lachnospiraceae bacterium]